MKLGDYAFKKQIKEPYCDIANKKETLLPACQ